MSALSTIGVIATNTVREVVRQRLFLNIAVFGVGMVLFGMVVSNLTFGYPDRVVRSIGLSGVSIAANLMGLLLGVGLIHREIDRKTLFVVLTRPVERWQYVVGRYLGLVASLMGVTVGFSLVFVVVLLYVGGTPHGQDAVAVGMALIEACLLGSFALALSSFSTPTLSAGIGLGFWIACASTDDLVNLTAQAEPMTRALARGISTVLPAFARFDFREAAVYADAVEAWRVLWTVGYGGLYAVGFVALASLILGRREMV